jgi:hypothetical protein
MTSKNPDLGIVLEQPLQNVVNPYLEKMDEEQSSMNTSAIRVWEQDYAGLKFQNENEQQKSELNRICTFFVVVWTDSSYVGIGGNHQDVYEQWSSPLQQSSKKKKKKRAASHQYNYYWIQWFSPSKNDYCFYPW